MNRDDNTLHTDAYRQSANSSLASCDLMVARGGIEPPTRGFSVRGRKRRNRLTQQEFVISAVKYFGELRSDRWLNSIDTAT